MCSVGNEEATELFSFLYSCSIYKPEITVQPRSVAKTEGDNVTLSCNATANPVPTISWVRDGSPVDSSRISFSEDNKQLTITDVNRTDSGEYRCVASNELGNDTSNAATLDIQFAPEISKNPEGLTIVEGQNVVFSCVVEGNPSPNVSWTKNGQGLNVAANSRLAASRTNNNHNLTITDVHRSDAGQYRCVAINSVDTSTSSAAKLEVYFAPEISKNPEGLTIVEGQNVVFSCVVEGNPSPNVSWTKNGQGLNVAANSRLAASRTNNNHNLTITDVHRSDAGQYRCVAINSVDTSTSSAAKLEVYCGTVIAINSSVEINDSRVDIPFFNQSQVQLAINATTPQDAGNYTCLVINDVGNSSDTTSLVIQVEPNRPLNVSVDSKSSQVVNISWIAGFDGNSAIQNYTVKRSLDNVDFVDAVCQGSLSDSSCVVSSASASVGNLSPWTLYYFKVFARNMVGTSDGSPVVNATTDEEEPGAAPKNVTGQNSSSTSIVVMWDEVPADQQNGIITSYTITYKSHTENDNGSVQVNASVHQTELTNLKEYVNYNITVFASTVKGDGPASDPIVVRTDQDMEPNRPLNVSVDSKSSLVVNISWIAGFDGNSAIQNYTVKRSLDNADFVDAVCQGSLSDSSCVVSSASASVGDLSPWTLYYFKVFARNMVGTSDGSPVVNATTNEEANDVEMNPGSCYRVHSSKTVSADYHKGDVSLFGMSVGQQCVAMCLIARTIYLSVEAHDLSLCGGEMQSGSW
ncbi:contactin-4-like [Orbicella faveolata]|uniref:contactin-4-like n=1 Tax=Orbicella faveolata TaxID=48498 RepID=UPI0009E21F9C|nr:contactin-4-like [Orbicella faveolata]